MSNILADGVNQQVSDSPADTITEADLQEMQAIISGGEQAQENELSGVTEESPTSEVDTDESPEGETAGEGEPEKDANTRIRQLNRDRKILEEKNKRLYARTKKAEEEMSSLKLELEKHRRVLQTLHSQYKEDLGRLQEAEYQDPVERENRLLKREQQWSSVRSEIEREQLRIKKEVEDSTRRQMEEEQTAMKAVEVMEEFEDVLSRYPGVTMEQLAFAVDADLKDAGKSKRALSSIDELAKRIDEDNFKRYESRILEKNKSRVTAPKVMRSNSDYVTADPELDSDDDLIRHMRLKLGEKWYI